MIFSFNLPYYVADASIITSYLAKLQKVQYYTAQFNLKLCVLIHRHPLLPLTQIAILPMDLEPD